MCFTWLVYSRDSRERHQGDSAVVTGSSAASPAHSEIATSKPVRRPSSTPGSVAATMYEVPVERGKIREFARAAKSENPAYYAEDAVVPPTFLTTALLFWG